MRMQDTLKRLTYGRIKFRSQGKRKSMLLRGEALRRRKTFFNLFLINWGGGEPRDGNL